ncbi:hypothetical protein [Sediminicoccus rosea]|uniref:Uncharacterized protein n=1 Tax=Sediminicoccus rosea TaxID=1225128 RepID=A0ABZ0PCM3_9PROT|nr:hypothetical protein [Sediminicoccus rosea]WPB83443.1 hypothetical protein R9Z33_15175 [Sediminicoccus rosea]
MTGFRFLIALREPGLGPLSDEMAELDGVPAIGHRLRVRLPDGTADLFIAEIIWFHSPGALSPSGQLILTGHRP